jgi:hypothetical protein
VWDFAKAYRAGYLCQKSYNIFFKLIINQTRKTSTRISIAIPFGPIIMDYTSARPVCKAVIKSSLCTNVNALSADNSRYGYEIPTSVRGGGCEPEHGDLRRVA